MACILCDGTNANRQTVFDNARQQAKKAAIETNLIQAIFETSPNTFNFKAAKNFENGKDGILRGFVSGV